MPCCDIAVGTNVVALLEPGAVNTGRGGRKHTGYCFQVRVRSLSAVFEANEDDMGTVIPCSAGNRVGGKMIISESTDKVYWLAEDSDGNFKPFQVPKSGTINSNKFCRVLSTRNSY
eukprot:scaffold9105_cov151-Amphora_coffeaeformis.AAC.4